MVILAEIFLVDNGSYDNTVSILKTFQFDNPKHIFPILLDTNTGTTYSRNLALKRASGQYICVMDSDIEIIPGVVIHLIQTLQEHEKIGLVVPKLVYPNKHLQKSTDMFPTIQTKLLRYFFLKQIEKQEHRQEATVSQQQGTLREVDYAISALWMLKREVLTTAGFLDEHIFYAPEDVDYCLRIWKAGYSIVYNPNISCIHHTQEISRGFKINKALLSHIYGLTYYFWKHKYLFSKPNLRGNT